MGKSIVQKILEKHIIEGNWEPGKEIAIKIDQTLTQDATGTMAYLQFEAMGASRVKTELSVSYVDHNTVQIGFENADDHKYLQSVAAKYGIIYSRAGNGICHQVHLERFGKPSKTLLGSDSHTPTSGGIGMVAIGAGGLDVAVAMAGGPFYLTCPKVIKVNLKGKLKPWCAAKDVVLKMLEIFTTKGNVGCVFEYSGEGVKTLNVPERATITNMGAECGVTTSVFPSDDTTKAFLRAQGREDQWVELTADPDAEYFKEKMIESRQRKKEQRERVRRMLAESRSEALPLQAVDFNTVPGLADALNSLTEGLAESLEIESQDEFNLKHYEEHIQAHIQDFPVSLVEIPPLSENSRKDLIWRFIAVIFLAHAGIINVRQQGQNLIVIKHETNRKRQDILGELEEADGIQRSMGGVET